MGTSTIKRSILPKRRFSPYKRSAILQFVVPFLVLYSTFRLWPMIYSLALSFHSWRGLGPWTFIGIENYRAFFRDPRIMQAVTNTFIMGIGELLITVPVGFTLALLLDNQRLRGKTFFRVMYFMPRVIALAVAAVAFTSLLHSNYGVLNYVLSWFGISAIPWLQEPGWARLSVVLVRSWVFVGFTMIYFTAGLQGIPRDLYEAASIDGAGWFQTMFRIKIPLLRGVVLFIVIIGTVQAFQLFAVPYLLTEGGPSRATTSVIMIMLSRGISSSNYGIASAITVAFTVFLGLVAALQFKLGGRE